jgi:hypothetical protein
MFFGHLTLIRLTTFLKTLSFGMVDNVGPILSDHFVFNVIGFENSFVPSVVKPERQLLIFSQALKSNLFA